MTCEKVAVRAGDCLNEEGRIELASAVDVFGGRIAATTGSLPELVTERAAASRSWERALLRG
jgi:hypothetical protein